MTQSFVAKEMKQGPSTSMITEDNTMMDKEGSLNVFLFSERTPTTYGPPHYFSSCDSGYHECTGECKQWEDQEINKGHRVVVDEEVHGGSHYSGSENLNSRIEELEGLVSLQNNEIESLKQKLKNEQRRNEELQKKLGEMNQCTYPDARHTLDVEKAAASLSSFKSLPIVDMSLPMEEVARCIDRACREVGFMYIINHNVDQALIQQTFTTSKAFFDLPLDEKEKVAVSKSASGARGFFRLGEENLNGKDGTRELDTEGSALNDKTYLGDLKEGFDCGRDVNSSDPDFHCPLVDYNQWPATSILTNFEDNIMQYQSAMLTLANPLLEAFAVGLGVPKSFFLQHTKRPMCTLRLLHYPPQSPDKVAAEDQLGCGAHTDYGLFTILNQDSVGGLQVRNVLSQWIDAPPIPNSFVINVGDMMSRWTNGQYSSTVHRVINQSEKERYSIPFFFNPDHGTPVVSIAERSHYAPSTSEAILLQRYQQAFAHMKN